MTTLLLSSLSLLVVDLICGVLDRVFSKPDLFSHVVSTANRALPSSSSASQLPFSPSRSSIRSLLVGTHFVLRRRRPYLFFAFCFVVLSYVVAFVSLYFLCVCSLLVFTMYYLRGGDFVFGFILVFFAFLAAVCCYGGLEWVFICSCGY